MQTDTNEGTLPKSISHKIAHRTGKIPSVQPGTSLSAAAHGTRGFSVLDLRAVAHFRTLGSIGYILQKNGKEAGWIDIHYPCEGPVKTKIRVGVPADYFDPYKMNEIISCALGALHIPLEHCYDAEFVFQPSPLA